MSDVLTKENTKLNHLRQLEAESIHIIREVASEFKNPVMLYSVGKDSSVMLHLARKAFFPAKIPFPMQHVDTGYKFPEMYEFRDNFCKEIGVELRVHRNEEAIVNDMNPFKYGTDKCCAALKTGGLLQALEKGGYDAAFGGARREEEKSRAKERVYSVRDEFGQWDPKNQRPELWNLYNSMINEGESIRVFPLSNWTEIDIWEYVKAENIPIVPIYYAQERECVVRNGIIIPIDRSSPHTSPREGEEVVMKKTRFRSLGCMPCTGAVESDVTDIDGIIDEAKLARRSERENRVIDLGSDSSMEDKKKEGYF